MDTQYVIIYSIKVYKFQLNGKILNIEVHKEIQIILIELKLCLKHIIKRYLIKIVIIIQY